jgi:hypothetical protein
MLTKFVIWRVPIYSPLNSSPDSDKQLHEECSIIFRNVVRTTKISSITRQKPTRSLNRCSNVGQSNSRRPILVGLSGQIIHAEKLEFRRILQLTEPG